MAPKSRGKKADEKSKVASSPRTAQASAAIEAPKDDIPPLPTWQVVGSAIAFMALAGLASPVSQANLSPVYGSIPSAIFHQQGITAVTMVAFIASKLPVQKYIPRSLVNFLPVIAYYIPVIQWALFPLSTRLGAETGPLVTESLTFFPLLLLAYLSVSVLFNSLDAMDIVRTSTDSIRPALSFGLFYASQYISKLTLPQIIGKADFLTRTSLSLVLASLYAAITRSQWLLLCSPAMLHTLFLNPHHQSPTTSKALNRTLAASNYSLLDRRDSLTGYVSVLEDHANGYRVLRCDHSLLGGEWLLTDERKAQGQLQRETIYSVFTMLESVRLVEVTEREDSLSDALFIGLGIGTSPSAFINRGINTTIVELDPTVHEFATKYFDLPSNHTAILSDAVDFVSSASISQPHSYDYIVHDVFTGGAEPTALFTLEFLRGLKALLKQDGVVAINYAGDITLPPPRIVLATIHEVFPSCRIFRDAVPDPVNPTNFINMVVFCKNSAVTPLTFRRPTEDDWRGSLSRREYVPPNAELEITLDEISRKPGGFGGDRGKPVILTRDNEAVIERFHRDHAVRHWGLMRTVLPAAVWENW